MGRLFVVRRSLSVKGLPMTIAFHCAGCASVLKVPDEMAGRRGKCPRCGAANVIPTAGKIQAAPQPPGLPGRPDRPGARPKPPPPKAEEILDPEIVEDEEEVEDEAPRGKARKRARREEEGNEAPPHRARKRAARDEDDEDDEDERPRRRRRKSKKRGAPTLLILGLVAGGLLLLGGGVGVGLWYFLSSPLGDEMKFMPDNCRSITCVRVDQLLASDAYQQLAREVPKVGQAAEADLEKEIGLPASAIERVVVGDQASGAAADHVIAVRTKQPVKTADLLAKIKRGSSFKESKVKGYTLHEADKDALCVVDKKLVLYGTAKGLRAVLERDKKPTLSDGMQAALKAADLSQTVTVAVDLKAGGGRPSAPGLPGGGVDLDAFRQAEGLVIQGKVKTDVTLNVIVLCKDAASAADVKKKTDDELAKLRQNPLLPKDLAAALDIKVTASGSKVTASTDIKVAPLIKTYKDLVGKVQGAGGPQPPGPGGPPGRPGRPGRPVP
jgi:hypothetical protein